MFRLGSNPPSAVRDTSSTFVDFLRSEQTDIQRAVFTSLCGVYTGAMFSFPERCVGIVALWVVLLAAHQVLIRRRI